MNLPPYSGWRSGRATPSLRTTPNTAHHIGNRQKFHLCRAESCSDESGHLFDRARDQAVDETVSIVSLVA